MKHPLALAVCGLFAFAASVPAHAFQSLVLTPNWVDFGQVTLGSSESESLTVQNVGDEDLTSVSSFIFGDTSSFHGVNTCGYLPRYGICTLQVSFMPIANGHFTAGIQVTAGAATAMANLAGTGVNRPTRSPQGDLPEGK